MRKVFIPSHPGILVKEIMDGLGLSINAENTWWSIRKRQFTSAANLIVALGGEWDKPALPDTGNNSQQDTQ